MLDGWRLDDGVWIADDGTRLRAISGGGGGSPKVPGPPPPTKEEIQIQQQQVNLLKKQVELAEKQAQALRFVDPKDLGSYLSEEVKRARELGPIQQKAAVLQLESLQKGAKLQDALQPFVLSSLRLVEQPNGQIRRMTEEEYVGTLSGPDRMAYDNLQLSLQREAKALKGELPLSEASQQRKRDEFTAFKEQMARGGNPITGEAPESASSTSTAGAQALKAFQERWALVEEAERQGELTSGAQSVLARMGVASDIGARNREGMLTAFSGRYGGGVPTGRGMAAFPSFGMVSPDFAGALQPFQAQRAGQMQANFANAQIRMANEQAQRQQNAAYGTAGGALIGGIIGSVVPGIGTLVGAGVGASVGGGVGYAASSRDVKKNIRRASRKDDQRALAMVKGLDGYTFRYKGESGRSPKRMGMMADQVPAEIATPDRRGIDVGRTLGLLTAATRELARKKGR